MRLCLKLAGIARERGAVPVGSVIVREGADEPPEASLLQSRHAR